MTYFIPAVYFLIGLLYMLMAFASIVANPH